MNSPTAVTFLDLEGTCIDSLSNARIINTEKLRPLIKGQEIGIFALSIQTKEDKKNFETNIQPALEDALGVRVKYIIGAEDMLDLLERKAGCHFTDTAELCMLLGKEILFLTYVKSYPISGVRSYVLFDDSVQNSQHSYDIDERRRTVVRLINIDEGPIWKDRFS